MLSCSELRLFKQSSIANRYFRYKKVEDARMALEQMEGFELAGRTVSLSFKTLSRL
jgi:hypothetical protein